LVTLIRKGVVTLRRWWTLLQCHPRWRASGRFRIWLVAGIAAVSVVMLIDLGRLLGDIQSPDHQAYDSGVFTEPKIDPRDTRDFEAALSLWKETARDASRFTAERLLRAHLLIDALAFAPAYCLLLFWGLGRIVRPQFAMWTAIGVLAADEIETWATWVLIRDLAATPSQLTLIQALTLIKIAALIAAIVPAAIRWGVDSYSRRAAGKPTENAARPLLPLIVLVALFASLIALPAGGPLEQFPDVLRAQLLSDSNWAPLGRSAFSLALFAACITIAGRAATVRARGAESQQFLKRGLVPLVAVALSVLMSVVVVVVDEGAWNPVPLSYSLVAAGFLVAAFLARIAGHKSEWRSKVVQPDTAQSDAYVARVKDGVRALAGAIVVIAGLGLVRAAFPPLILSLKYQEVVWWAAGSAGIVIALAGGFATQSIMGRLSQERVDRPQIRRVSGVLGTLIVAILALVLVCSPLAAAFVGTFGVVAISFGLLALLMGLLKWISRRCRPWKATWQIGLGDQTPWLAIVVLTWGVASLLNNKGVYHDARVKDQLASSDHRYPDLNDAFNKWLAVQQACLPPQNEPIPMVFLAAPGGGIRAAYWTGETLERLFGSTEKEDCAARRLFAISSVSGGSVGATTWIASRAKGYAPRPRLEQMSSDHALAAAAAGMLLRDLWQPLLGISRGWRDRAALLEDSWQDSTFDLYGSSEQPLMWSTLGEGSSWVPAIVLNASSVTDGCRVLISNVGTLVASSGAQCDARPHAARPVSAAIDPLPGLCRRDLEKIRGPEDKDDELLCAKSIGSSRYGLRAVTAALLSARFPFVTPSGALVRRIDQGPRDAVTYVVDGGYYENSGLLTLLQMWQSLEPWVRAYNETPGIGSRIAPWIVVADNHYRNTAQKDAARRPRELGVPLRTLANDSEILSPGALEQMAAVAITRPAPVSCERPETASGQDEASAVQCKVRDKNPKSQYDDCLVVISPSREPSVAAPLGWVLSETSRFDLQRQLGKRLDATNTRQLLRQLGKAPADGRSWRTACVWRMN
jgi:hypothetical protein